MTNLMYKTSLLLLALSATAAYASPGIRLGIPAAGGNGCPNGTVSATLSPDETSLSILFDQFIAEAGGDTGRTVDRKSCNVAVPVYIPPGIQISVIAVDYRGFNALPSGASSRMTADYFFSNSRGLRFQRDFYGPTSSDFLFTNQMTAITWSNCGASTNLRINASALVQTRDPYGPNAQMIVDSADINAGLVYKLSWRSCR